MGNPPSHQDFRHTCPTCNRPVRHGDKFCEVCGTRIPSLSTCSKCGTQFIHPKKFCDLCGAPFILEEVPEEDADGIQEPGLEELPVADSDEVPEPDEEQIPELAEEETPEPYTDETEETDAEVITETGADEVPEPDEEELPEPIEEETPEPDTAELLEQFGDEYSDDETLDSLHKVKPAAQIQPRIKKPVTVPPIPRGVSSETVDDALFLADTEAIPAKPPVKKIMIIGGVIGLVTILAVIFFIGVPLLTGTSVFNTNSNPVSTEVTPIPTITTPVVKLTPASGALVPQPTETIPPGQKVFFHIEKNPITSKILVIFTGSAGSGSISSADVKVTHTDGSVTMGVIQPLKGINEIYLAGTKEPDRVEIIAKMSTGESYRIYDSLVTS